MSLNPHTCQKCAYFWKDALPIADACPSCGDAYPALTTEQALTVARLIREVGEELYPAPTPVSDPPLALTTAAYEAIAEYEADQKRRAQEAEGARVRD